MAPAELAAAEPAADARAASDGRAFFDSFLLGAAAAAAATAAAAAAAAAALSAASMDIVLVFLSLGVRTRAGAILRTPPLGEAPLALPLPFTILPWTWLFL